VKVLITFGCYFAAVPGAVAPRARAGAELMAICTGVALARRGHLVAFGTDGPPPVTEVPLPCVDGHAAALPWVPDVVHAFDLARPATVRLGSDVATRHAVPFVLTPSSAREVWPDVAFGDAACAAADLVLALSPAELDDLALAERTSARQVGQGPCLAATPDPAAFRRRLPGDGPVVLFLGRRNRLKGLDVLAGAAPLVWRSSPEAMFAVAGPPGDAGIQVEALADRRFVDLGEVDLQGKTDALAGCTVLCLPSRADVFPLVFVEAWTLGRPVVSGDFRGVADVVRHGVDGLVCAATPAAVAGALVTLLADPGLAARLGAAGRERAARELTWQSVAETVESCYIQLSRRRWPR
jgi:glycosyltransferase involved in cell wall biosynthesis